jgi:AcrR family transcriptional regulator
MQEALMTADPEAPETAAGVRRRVGPKRSEASADAVMEAAYAELIAHGWRDFSVDRLARNARASKQTVYRWWRSAACLAVDCVLVRIPAARPAQGDARDRIAIVIEPILLSARTGDGAHALRAAVLAAADDQDAGEIFRAWMTERVRVPLRHVLAELALRGVIRKDWDIDMAVELLLGPVWHRLIALRGPVPEVYLRRLVDTMLRGLAPV